MIFKAKPIAEFKIRADYLLQLKRFLVEWGLAQTAESEQD